MLRPCIDTNWRLTPREAVRMQALLRDRVRLRRPRRRPRLVAGADVAYDLERKIAHAGVIVFALPGLEEIERQGASRPLTFPYVPGLLSFRESPSILDAFDRLTAHPDLILVDGHGLAHPRRFGIACHLGVELELPTIGIGKSRLGGEHREPGLPRGCRTQLKHKGEVIGTVLRTRDGVKPIYVSIGHRVDLETAVKYVLRCARRYRLPEPIRAADQLAGRGTGTGRRRSR